MPKQKPSTIKLQVFKGREAKLNKTIFTILSRKGALTVYALLKEIKKQRGFTDTKDGVMSRRVEALEKQDYLMKVGTVKTHVGSYAPRLPDGTQSRVGSSPKQNQSRQVHQGSRPCQGNRDVGNPQGLLKTGTAHAKFYLHIELQ